MPFRPIQSDKLSTAVVRQIEELILRGILRPGERLPAERELAERLAVSRPSLREAFNELQTVGLLDARAGSGVYVADVLGSAFSPALQDLMSRHNQAVDDYLDFRRDMEGLAAERAARLASDTDLKVIQTIFEKMQSAHTGQDPHAEGKLDAQFHMAIIEAAHNIVMLHMMRSMFELLQQGVFYSRTIIFADASARTALLDQHRGINAALQSRDSKRARAAIETHLDYVKAMLSDQRRAAKNEALARLRLDHETGA